MTHMNTVISPEEMTVDPIFDYDSQLMDVSNVHDLSKMTGLFDCERAVQTAITTTAGTSSTGDTGKTPSTVKDPDTSNTTPGPGQPATTAPGVVLEVSGF